MASADAIRIDQPSFKSDPYPTYAYWRADKPVCSVRLPIVGIGFALSRYDDVLALLKDLRFVKDRANIVPLSGARKQASATEVFSPITNTMLDKDNPDHLRLRRLVQGVFTQRSIESMEQRIKLVTESLLDQLMGRKTIDLIGEFALLLPATIISDLLGVPERDRGRFVRWSKALVTIAQSSQTMELGMPRLRNFLGYVTSLIEQRRAEPRGDLVSALVLARDRDEMLTQNELLSMIVLLVFAGHETTTNLIGNGLLALIQNPDQLDRLRADPGMIGTAVEEMLRFAPPVEASTFRYARENVEIAGTKIRQGEVVIGLLNSANRDAAHFVDPDRFDIARAPNRHLTFGVGSHQCLGASLARLEVRIAIGALLRRFRSLAVDPAESQLTWSPSVTLRGLKRLPLRVAT